MRLSSSVILAGAVLLCAAAPAYSQGTSPNSVSTSAAQTPATAPAPAARPAPLAGCPPVSLSMPNALSVKLDGLPAPSGGPGWFGSAVLAAIATAIASLIGIVVSADKRRSVEMELLHVKHQHELALQKLAEEHKTALQLAAEAASRELAELDRKFQAAMKTREREHQKSSQEATLGREDQRIALERERLRSTTNASEIDIQVQATRLAREHGLQFANMVNMFFDKLSSADPAHRQLAVLAMSAFVDVDEFEKFLNEKFNPPAPDAQARDGATAPAGPV